MSGFWRRRRVLVTGGASFIGSHLAERLVAAGARVRVADDLSSGRRAHVRSIAGDIEFLRGDLRHTAFAARACRGQTTIFHLAARHGGRGYIDTHRAECASNAALDGTVFSAAADAGVERICYASSACVYPVGSQQGSRGAVRLLAEEDAQPGSPVDADGEYGWAKWMGEVSLRAYHDDRGVGASICRLFTVYGERCNETHAIPALIAKARLKLDPFPVWGSGRQRRNFTYVGDAVDAMMRAAERIVDATAVNIGAAEVVRIEDLVTLILHAAGFEPKRIRFETGMPTGVTDRAADLSRARKLLRWTPKTSLADGLARTLTWHLASRRTADLQADIDGLFTER